MGNIRPLLTVLTAALLFFIQISHVTSVSSADNDNTFRCGNWSSWACNKVEEMILATGKAVMDSGDVNNMLNNGNLNMNSLNRIALASCRAISKTNNLDSAKALVDTCTREFNSFTGQCPQSASYHIILTSSLSKMPEMINNCQTILDHPSFFSYTSAGNVNNYNFGSMFIGAVVSMIVIIRTVLL